MWLDRVTLPYFFTLSLAAHVALVPLLGRKPFSAAPALEPIAVSILPPPIAVERERTLTAPPLPPRDRALRASPRQRRPAPAPEKKPAPRPALKSKPVPAAPQESAATPTPAPSQPQIASRTEPAPMILERPAIVDAPPPNDQAIATPGSPQAAPSILREDNALNRVGREQIVPGIRDLTPYNKPIPLNTRDPVLAPFTKVIERWIEAQWQYPDLAKHYGLQGKVTVEFTVLQNGQIDLLSVVRSSGSTLLDDEAIRAIKAAAPFPPIPRSITAARLRIVAGFTYLNNRVALTNNP